MKRLVLILVVIFAGGCSVFTPLQKSKFLTVHHLTETRDYADAKVVIEEMIESGEFSEYPRTWHLRGVLAQTAYRDRNQNLYTDQLYVIFESFERYHELSGNDRTRSQLKPRYIQLANDFQRLGEREFRNRNYNQALKAFEHALLITRMPALSIPEDKSLVYNTALAAYESQQWDRAEKHLGKLHRHGHSTNATHLLYKTMLAQDDKDAARKVLMEGVGKYDDNEEIIMLLVDFLADNQDEAAALDVLREAISNDPDNHNLYYTKGLIYQRTGRYNDAVLSYFDAHERDPEHLMTYVNIATCYYNIGVEIDEESRTLVNQAEVNEMRIKSEAAYESAVTWLDKVYEKQPDDRSVLSVIYDLYSRLRLTDRARNIENNIN